MRNYLYIFLFLFLLLPAKLAHGASTVCTAYVTPNTSYVDNSTVFTFHIIGDDVIESAQVDSSSIGGILTGASSYEFSTVMQDGTYADFNDTISNSNQVDVSVTALGGAPQIGQWEINADGNVCSEDFVNSLSYEAITSPLSTYTMDGQVLGAGTGLLESLIASVLTIIPLAIAIVGGLVVTLFGLRWLIRFARSNMHG